MPFTKCLPPLILLLISLAAIPLHAGELPLGDGKISTSPRAGYLMPCTRHWRGGGAVHGGAWIQGDKWNPAAKPTVQGSVTWPSHRFSVTTEGANRIVSTNDLPDHATGRFPIAPSDPAYHYDRNPNAIRPQNVTLRLPAHPVPAAQPSCVPMGLIGVALDGTAIYSAVDDAGRDAAAHEIQDRCGGHPQHRGQYHYHGPSSCLPGEKSSGLIGYALDGFGIYGMKDAATGHILHDGDLDACHGTTSEVLWDGRRVNIYHYVLTAEYPYSVGCFRGTPVSAGRVRGHRPPPGRRPMRRDQAGYRQPPRY